MFCVPQVYHKSFKNGNEDFKMNEINVLNGNSQVLEQASNALTDASNAISDIAELLETIDNPIARTAVRTMNTLTDSLLQENVNVIGNIIDSEKDDRAEYLDNLRGYFNEETGTWYEQICTNYKKITGFDANKWTALTWTIHLSLGHSTFEYLVHQNIIKKNSNGEWQTYLPLVDLKRYGDDIERIEHLIDTGFQELK